MDDLKEKIYLLALDMIKNRKKRFICKALRESYKEYTGTKGELNYEELEGLFPEFFNLYDGRYWYCSENEFRDFIDQQTMHGAWWSSELMEPRKKILELILSRGCR